MPGFCRSWRKLLRRTALPATLGRGLAPADLAADVADPVQHELTQDVAATDDADQLVAAEHRQPRQALLDQQRPRRADVGVLGDRHHVRAHHLAGRVAVPGEQVEVADHPDDVALVS